MHPQLALNLFAYSPFVAWLVLGCALALLAMPWFFAVKRRGRAACPALPRHAVASPATRRS
jgi:hypothetical protein